MIFLYPLVIPDSPSWVVGEELDQLDQVGSWMHDLTSENPMYAFCMTWENPMYAF
jgi:hypothetical protein